MSEVHVFDVDHTITRKAMGSRFMAEGLRSGVFPLSVLFFMPLWYLRYRFSSLEVESLNEEIPMLKGKSREFLEDLARKALVHSIHKDIYPEAEAVVKRLQRDGKRVILASSAFEILLLPLAEYLEIDTIIATKLAFNDGISTGGFEGLPAFQNEKKRRVLEYISQEGHRAEDYTFYSDSFHDLPLLEAIGTPVAVNPDIRLRKAAKKRDWTILRFS
ncbi:MAG: HAD-IB family hydrolase [Spirochaetales bacterium]|nr:HAD-IB family hydrolase [Spirochaetales bacterium]